MTIPASKLLVVRSPGVQKAPNLLVKRVFRLRHRFLKRVLLLNVAEVCCALIWPTIVARYKFHSPRKSIRVLPPHHWIASV